LMSDLKDWFIEICAKVSPDEAGSSPFRQTILLSLTS
jgi:hypothetical protein